MLKNKRIIVTGAGSGIGLAIAHQCLAEGAIVGVNYRPHEDGPNPSVSALLADAPDHTMALACDITHHADTAALFRQFADRFGVIDGLVNNAGINRAGLLVSQPVAAMMAQIETNLVATIMCARAVLPTMMGQRSGTIVNVSSVSAVRPSRGQAVYAATKGAVASLTKAMAVEYGAKGIRVHGVRPGPIDTRMLAVTAELAKDHLPGALPGRWVGTPEDVAALVVFLLSDKSRFVNGAIHTVDGGMTSGWHIP